MNRIKSDPFSHNLGKDVVLRLLSGKRLSKKDQSLYHKTDHFKSLKELAVDTYGTCVACGRVPSTTPPTVHHRHYKTLFCEDVLKDVCLLCNRCHRKVHGKG